jgi:hypothetical protein
MMTHRPGFSSSPAGAIEFAPAGLFRLSDEAAGLFQLELHAPAECAVPIEAAELGARGLLGELRPPRLFGRRRPANRLPLSWLMWPVAAFAIFGIFQIIRMHILPLRLEITVAGWQPPARANASIRVALLCGAVGRLCSLICIRTRSARCRIDSAATIMDNRGAILTAALL